MKHGFLFTCQRENSSQVGVTSETNQGQATPFGSKLMATDLSDKFVILLIDLMSCGAIANAEAYS